MYSTLYHPTHRGWPDCLKQVPRIAHHIWDTHDELSIKTGILLKGASICIPSKLLDHTLTDLHGAHQGMEQMQAQAREVVYWPSIDTDVINDIKRCPIYTKHKDCGRKLQPIISTTKVKSISSSVICSVNIPYCSKSYPNQPCPQKTRINCTVQIPQLNLH